MRKSILAAAVALAATAPPTAAQNDPLVTRLGPAELRALAQRYDSKSQDVSTKKTGTIYDLQSGRETAFLVVEGKEKETLRIYSRIKGVTTLEKLNAWNRDKIHGRAYLDNDGSVVFESTLWLRGGVTQMNVRNWIDLHFEQLPGFQQLLNGTGPITPTENPRP
jgi:hypothetical protein